MTAASSLPNILTSIRIVLGLAVFVCLAAAAGAVPILSGMLTGDDQFALMEWAFYFFIVAATTDFVDGWVARRLHAESAWGATLDPIADKILLAAAVLGLLAQGAQPYVSQIAVPSALIIFREFFVSSLRETAAARGIKLPVTGLAKWKTAVQLVALTLVLLVAAWPSLGLEMSPAVYEPVQSAAYGGMWIAALLTLWTGFEYAMTANKRLRGMV
jgi:CDP-diacylglycerol--glycerol-3-phosphate 3-phosphatidyltransferase